MKKCDEASPSIILAGRALLVEMLITLEPDGIFGSNSVGVGKMPAFKSKVHATGVYSHFPE